MVSAERGRYRQAILVGEGGEVSRHRRSIGPTSSVFNAEKNKGAAAPLLMVRDESHRLSLGELLSSIARFRFAGCFHATRVGCLCVFRIRAGICSAGVGAEGILEWLQSSLLRSKYPRS
jgi:hypothetical protein